MGRRSGCPHDGLQLNLAVARGDVTAAKVRGWIERLKYNGSEAFFGFLDMWLRLSFSC